MLVVLCATMLRLSASLDPYLHPWDERYHALVAKHLAVHPLTPTLYSDPKLPNDPTNWTASRNWVHKPPGALWCIALCIKLIGAIPLAVRLPSILLSALSAFLLVQLGASMASRSVGFWAALLFAVNGHLIELAPGRTSTDHVDAIFVAVMLAALSSAWRMCATRKWWWAMFFGALFGASFLTKSWPAFLALPVVYMMLRGALVPWRMGITFLGVGIAASLIMILPWSIYSQLHFPDEIALEHLALWSHVNTGVEEHERPWYYYLAQLPMMQGELISLFFRGR